MSADNRVILWVDTELQIGTDPENRFWCVLVQIGRPWFKIIVRPWFWQRWSVERKRGTAVTCGPLWIFFSRGVEL